MPFRDLLGHRDVRERLRTLAATDRLPGSLLFVGPEGVGKRTVALALAQTLNCLAPEAGDACGRCPACRRIAQDEFADVAVVRPEGKGGQIKVDRLRAVLAELPFRPFEGRWRVLVVDEADRLNPAAANTMLKTLEEPPARARIVLVTAHEASLLPTIRSRCQAIRFGPLAAEDVAALLAREGDVDRERAILAAALAGGSPARARELLSEELGALRGEALEIAALAARPSPAAERLALADTLARRADLLPLLRLVVSLLRDLVAASAGGDLLHADRREEIEHLAAARPLADWLEAYGETEQVLYDIETRYANKRIALEGLFLAFGERAGAPAASPRETARARRR